MAASRAVRLPILPGLGVLLLCPLGNICAQDLSLWSLDPILPRDPESTFTAPARPNRIRLFGIQPGFLSEPVGLEDEQLQEGDPPAQADDGPNWLQLSMGSDNPFFDFRRSGEPGGIGYYRIYSQAQLFDSPTTSCSVNLQAVAPAGQVNNGLNDGPTVLSPSVSVFHSFGTGTAIQGYVGKNATVGAATTYSLPRSTHYGVAVQQPAGDEISGLNNVYFFLGALGRYRYVNPMPTKSESRLQILPGMHWQLSESWWLSGGVAVPVESDGLEHRRLHFMCSFRF